MGCRDEALQLAVGCQNIGCHDLVHPGNGVEKKKSPKSRGKRQPVGGGCEKVAGLRPCFFDAFKLMPGVLGR